MKKILSILLAALLMLSVMPVTVFAAETDSDSVGASYDLWLGETQVTDDNKHDILGDGGKAKFDPATNTLTLNEPTIPGVCVRNSVSLTARGRKAQKSARSIWFLPSRAAIIRPKRKPNTVFSIPLTMRV